MIWDHGQLRNDKRETPMKTTCQGQAKAKANQQDRNSGMHSVRKFGR
jgi:hypothetical protein